MSAINRAAAAGMIVLTPALAWTSIALQRVAADGAAPWTREWIPGWPYVPAVVTVVPTLPTKQQAGGGYSGSGAA
ncbi:hypothetical protein ACNF49_30495 [Actinomadura sp. ATCC 39365]